MGKRHWEEHEVNVTSGKKTSLILEHWTAYCHQTVFHCQGGWAGRSICLYKVSTVLRALIHWFDGWFTQINTCILPEYSIYKVFLFVSVYLCIYIYIYLYKHTFSTKCTGVTVAQLHGFQVYISFLEYSLYISPCVFTAIVLHFVWPGLFHLA